MAQPILLDDDASQQPPADGELFARPFGRDGRPLPDPFSIFQNPERVRAASARLIVPADVPGDYIPVGHNLVTDSARQVLANLIGGRDFPARKWVASKVSFGVGDTVPRFTDTTLSPQPDPDNEIVGGENEIEVSAGVFKKTILSVDWPQPYIARWEIVLNPDEAVGYLIREMGLWTDGNEGGGDEVLLARKVFPGVNKSGDFGLSWLWRWRF